MQHLERNLATEHERNTTIHVKIEFVEKEKAVIVVEKETLSKCLAKKKNQILELLANLDHVKKRVRQFTIGSDRLNEVLNYGRNTIIKKGLGHEGK